jgi:hypothetical protein
MKTEKLIKIKNNNCDTVEWAIDSNANCAKVILKKGQSLVLSCDCIEEITMSTEDKSTNREDKLKDYLSNLIETHKPFKDRNLYAKAACEVAYKALQIIEST